VVSWRAVSASRERSIGPWLVALGAGLWGTESAWRKPFGDVFTADVLVLWEHVILVICALPLVIARLGELRRVQARTIAWLLFSGVAGSAVGTVLFTLALQRGNATVANVVLNAQPVLSTVAACLIFGDRLSRTFYPWAMLAVVAGIALVGLAPGTSMTLDAGAGYALLCALAWGLSTVAGRGVMVEMSLPLAAGLRVIVGLATMAVIVAVRGQLSPELLWPATAAAEPAKVVIWMVLLSTLSVGVPLLFYFKGLELTRASTAGYFERMQTLVAVVIMWGFFHAELLWYQAVAGVVLIGAVAMVQSAQERTASAYAEPAPAR
jgi:drug/metabolite transporter (DMT)-like permease